LGRLGAKVEMLAQLGNDETGHSYVKHFKENNVGTEHVKILDGQDSGIVFLFFSKLFNNIGQAYIMSLKNGNNAIVIVGGTNQAYDPNMTELDPHWAEAIRKSKILLLQREIPEYVNTIAAKLARESGTMVILDVGGRDEPFTTELLEYVDILTPNETELVRVLGKEPKNIEDQDRLITEFLRHHPRTKLLLKKGEYGSAIYYLEHPD
jgi:sugar/nucleoside kinase (ribokinase family)